MSLRVFHIVFVLVCILLSLFVGLWGVREYTREASAMALGVGVVFFAAAVGLVIYGRNVSRKLKELP